MMVNILGTQNTVITPQATKLTLTHRHCGEGRNPVSFTHCHNKAAIDTLTAVIVAHAA